MDKKQGTNLVAEMPLDYRPRERLLHFGPSALSDQELLAILLRTGSKESNVMSLALEVLNHFDNLYELKISSLEEIQKIKGIGSVKAIEIKAATELGLRLAKSNQLKLGQVVSSVSLGKMLVNELSDLHQEHLIALYLNTKNEIIKKETLYIGGLNQSVAHPREIFRSAVRHSAARIVLSHNHPSGNPTPSENDINFTKRISKCGELMGIEILDHVIVGEKCYISLREEGVL